MSDVHVDSTDRIAALEADVERLRYSLGIALIRLDAYEDRANNSDIAAALTPPEDRR